jgi:rhodanese-related sulfurtransferase
VDPEEASALVRRGALLIDIRPAAQRATFGQIPGALIIERNVLEWRLDPTGADRIAALEGPFHQIVLFCQEGYASSLAAASLQTMGLRRATDLEGGFAAWAERGLPVETTATP